MKLWVSLNPRSDACFCAQRRVDEAKGPACLRRNKRDKKSRRWHVLPATTGEEEEEEEEE
jgi:hypothetical protein